MKLWLLVALAACGGSPPPSPPKVENTAPPAATPCESANASHVVETHADGGTIELTGDRGEAMTKANCFMSAQCGEAAYTITQEGEEPIGDSHNPSDSAWRVHYVCAR